MSEHSDENSKASPVGAPFAARELAAKFRRAIDESEARSDLRVRLDVDGGPHDERYHFHFTTTGAHEAEAELHDRLRDRSVKRRPARLAAGDMTSLLKAIDVDGLVAASRIRPMIPPDSLVGRLRVGDGEQEVTVVFMADPEQARSAGYEPPGAVSRVVDRIYELGAKAVGAKDVRPD
jgi:hypothetical protein